MGVCSSSSAHQKVQLLEASPFVKELKPTELLLLAKHFEVKQFAVNEKVFREGDYGDVLFVIGKGSIELHADNPHTKRSKSASSSQTQLEFLGSKGQGEFFGERPDLAKAGRRAVTATVIAQATVLCMNGKAFAKYSKASTSVSLEKLFFTGPMLSKALNSVVYLRSMTNIKLQLLGHLCRPSVYDAGAEITRAGSNDRSLLIVAKGEVAVQQAAVQDAILGPGHHFGEFGLVLDIPRDFSAVAKETTTILHIDVDDFARFLRFEPAAKSRFPKLVRDFIEKKFTSLKGSIDFFDCLSEDKIATLAQSCKLSQYIADDVVYSQGEAGSKFFHILHGELSQSPVETKEERLVQGQYFGYRALFARGLIRQHTMRVTSPRAVLLTVDQVDFAQLFKGLDELYASLALRFAGDAAGLDAVVAHKKGVQALRAHLVEEYSEHNVDFVQEAAAYERMSAETENDRSAMVSKAVGIVAKYLEPNAEDQINIRASFRETILGEVAKGKVSRNTFAGARKEVLDQMRDDSYVRFKDSTRFIELIDECSASTLRKKKKA